MAGNSKSNKAEENMFAFFCTKIQESTNSTFANKVTNTIKNKKDGDQLEKNIHQRLFR